MSISATIDNSGFHNSTQTENRETEMKKVVVQITLNHKPKMK